MKTKNYQKGFVVLLLVAIIAVLVIADGVYIYKNMKTEAPVVIDNTSQQSDQNQNTNIQKVPATTDQTTPNDSSVNNTSSITSTQVKPSVTVISPNGGEVWAKGSQHNITWKPYNGLVTILLIPHIPTPNLPPNAGVGLMPPTPYPMVKIAENVDGPSGSYLWTVTTSTLAGTEYVNGDYYIKICSKDGTVCDQSNSDFTIASSLDYQLKYSGITDTGKEFSVKYPITWTFYKYSCNADGVAFWPKSIAPNFSQGGACGMESFLNNSPIEINTMSSQPTLYLRNTNYSDVYSNMSASLTTY